MARPRKADPAAAPPVDLDADPLPGALRAIRARLGLTQAGMAAALEVPLPTYARWEQGGPVQHERVLRLAVRALAG